MESLQQRAQAIALSALKLPEDGREDYVEQACAAGSELAERVRALLTAGDDVGAAGRSDPAAGAHATTGDHVERLRRALAGRYEILEEAGRGGMAVVYRARDVKHGRDVALKVLSPEVTSSVGSKRFLREIRIAASLQHPNILPLYDSGEADGFCYYVMPFVEGETLQSRIRREGALSVEATLAIAREVAGALDHAHEKGLVHRDVKPGNILFQDGRAMLADFGLATVFSGAEEERLTQSGMALGTPAYMSPEQAVGKEVDSKSDLYSLGCVVYEMLAGDPPFTGRSIGAVLARHVSDVVPPIRTVRPQLPRGVDSTLTRALAKVPADRYPSASALVEALCAPPASTAARKWWLLVVAGALAGALLLWSTRVGGSNAKLFPAETHPITFRDGPEYAGSLSADSASIVYSHTENGTMDLFVQPRVGGRRLQLTSDAGDELLPRWSRDGTRIAYVRGYGSECHIYTISALGGTGRKLVETHIPHLLSFWDAMGALGSKPWSRGDESLLFSRQLDTGEVAIFQVNLETGVEERVTAPTMGTHDLSASWSFEDDRIVFTRSKGGASEIWLRPPDGGDEYPLLQDEFVNSEPSFLPGDQHIIFTSNRRGSDDIWSLHLPTGELSQLTVGGGKDWYPSVSNDGMITYSSWSHETHLYTMDVATGDSEQLTTWTRDNFVARYSPKGDRIAYQSTRTGNAEIWVKDLETETTVELNLSEHPEMDVLPAWSPDGSEIAFLSSRSGAMNLWVAKSDGSAHPEQLSDQEIHIPSKVWAVSLSIRWTPDGDSIGYVMPAVDGPSLWVIDRFGGEPGQPVRSGVLRFDWYLDRHRIVYTTATENGLELRATHLATGADVLLYAGPHTEMILSPLGTAVALVQSASHFDQTLYLLELELPTTDDGLPKAKGEPKRMTHGQGLWHVHNGGWSHDGTRIVYTQDTDDGDIYSLTLRDE